MNNLIQKIIIREIIRHKAHILHGQSLLVLNTSLNLTIFICAIIFNINFSVWCIRERTWAIWHGGHLFEAYWLLRVQLAGTTHFIYKITARSYHCKPHYGFNYGWLHNHTTRNPVAHSCCAHPMSLGRGGKTAWPEKRTLGRLKIWRRGESQNMQI